MKKKKISKRQKVENELNGIILTISNEYHAILITREQAVIVRKLVYNWM